jgi:hypothetical protein
MSAPGRRAEAEAIVRDLAKLKTGDDDWGVRGVVAYDLPHLQERAERWVEERDDEAPPKKAAPK